MQKIYIMLEECALPYKEHFVDVWNGDQFTPEFLKLNPNGKIPVIVDHDGPGGKPITVIESGAILLYLADKTGKFLPKDMAKKYEAIQWLMIQLAGVGPMFGQWTHFKLFSPKGNDYSMGRYTSEIKRLYELLEQRLGQAHYLGGDEYSVADIATFPWTRNHDAHGREMGRPSPSRAVVQCDQRAPGGEGGACQGRGHQVDTRDRLGGRQGPLLRPRSLRPRLTVPRISLRSSGLRSPCL